MAELTPIAITKVGFDLSSQLVAADVAGDTVQSTKSGVFFAVENADAGAHTVTVTAPVASAVCGNYGAVDIDDIVVTVGAGETQVFTLPVGYAEDGEFSLAYDAVTSVSVGVFSLA